MEHNLLNLRAGDIIVRYQNPRRKFDDAALQELVASIKLHGVHTPILVNRLESGDLVLIAGERRLRAAKLARGDDFQIPAQVVAVTEDKAADLAFSENHDRVNMTPIEEAEAAARLLSLVNGNRDEVAKRLNLSRSTLDSRLALMNAIPEVRDAFIGGKILLGHAELMCALTKETQATLLANLLKSPELPTVDALRKTLEERLLRNLDTAIFDKKDCATCEHNSDVQRGFFGDVLAGSKCANRACFTAKTDAVLNERLEALKPNHNRVEFVDAGDQQRVIKLVVEGPKGVGQEQATACKACANHGAIVMKTPDQVGTVVEGVCFDLLCNSKMVAKQVRQATAATAAKPAASASAPKPAAGKPVKTQGAAAPSLLTGSVTVFRDTMWRNALKAEILASHPVALMVTMYCAVVTHRIPHLSGVPTGEVEKMVELLDGDDTARQAAFCECAAAMVPGMDIATVSDLLIFLKVDLRKHFELGEPFFQVLTKSAIESVAKEVGLDAAVSDFKKLLAGSKADLIKGLLGKTFDYRCVPGVLAPKASTRLAPALAAKGASQ